MTKDVEIFLSNLSEDWQPIKEQVEKYFDSKSGIREDGALEVFRRPWIAPLNYGLLLFPPADAKLLSEFTKRTAKAIPGFFQEILSQMNGCFVYDLSLFGLPQSIYKSGVLDRSQLNQFDLGAANRHWITEYSIENTHFHFGGRSYSYDENIGYFIDHANHIVSVRQNGDIVGNWTSFNQFLKDEVSIAEQMMLEEKPT